MGNHIELVFLPTSASWLNWIEAEFAALRYFALNGTDHRSHAEQADAMARLHALAQRGLAMIHAVTLRDFVPARDC